MGGEQQIRVGQVVVGMARAEGWVRDYTEPARVGTKNPYAFPAYDRMDTGSGPSTLNDGDLLAPVLLNVRLSLRAFYGLQSLRGGLEAQLGQLGEEKLEDLDQDTITSTMRSLFEPLDVHRAEQRSGFDGTTFSKVLHRKRPALIPLHDMWVKKCYVGEGAPVPRAKGRSWAEYMGLLACVMAENIRQQEQQFDRLAEVASEPLTRLRLLDIVAWSSKGESPAA